MKHFSLTIDFLSYEYDTHVVLLLRPMCKPVDGTQLHNEILIHMPRLQKFGFYITTDCQIDQSAPSLSYNDIQRTLTNINSGQINCIIKGFGIDGIIYHIFSVPFKFDRIGDKFPKIIISILEIFMYYKF